jgi:hypothetical protein
MAELQVPVTKGKGFITIDVDAIPQDVFTEVVLQGLKVLVNRGTSKITKEAYPDAEEMKSASMAKAAEQIELIMSSKIKFTGGKSAKASGITGAVKTEAMRLARNLVKDEMKRAGIKISHVKSSEITAAAKELLEAMPDLIEQAKANLAARDAVPVSGAINIKSLIHEDADLVAKAEAKKSKAGGTLSAKQAGKVTKRAKGEQVSA